MTDHGYFEELICAQLDGELTPAQAEELGTHLAACPRCRAFRDAMTAVEGVSDRHLPDPPAELAANVMAAVRAQAGEKKKKGKILGFPVRTLAVAAAAALVLWAGVRVSDIFRPKGAAAPMMAASAVTEEAPEAAEAAESEAALYSADMAETPAEAAPPAEAGGFVSNSISLPETAGGEKAVNEAVYSVYDASGALLRTASEAELPAGLLVCSKPCPVPDRDADYRITLLPPEGESADFLLWEADGVMILTPPEGESGECVSAEVFHRFLEP